MQAFATFKTEQARRYVRTFCEHFGPQAAQTSPPFDVRISFQFGQCSLAGCDDQLELCAQAEDQAQLVRVIEIMTRYLERFAFRENPKLSWCNAPVVVSAGVSGARPTEITMRAHSGPRTPTES
ncbi:MAG: DUF2218 domain-containing protein [Pseudomonadota bacterium]